MNKTFTPYADYPQQPYISPERNLAEERLSLKPVPRRNMESLENGLLAGDVILLWRIAFGTFTNKSVFPKYLEYSYGINGPAHLEDLLAKGYASLETALDSLDHITATLKKAILKEKGLTGLSALKSGELDQAIKQHLSEEELASYFSIRGYTLTDKGHQALAANQEVIDRHPKKKY